MFTQGLCFDRDLVKLFRSKPHRDASSVSSLFDETEGRKVLKSGFVLNFWKAGIGRVQCIC